MIKRLVYWFFCWNDTTQQDDISLRMRRARAEANRHQRLFK
jgi:hypothetical protein